MCIYILVGLFLYMMSAPVHGYLGAYFGMQGRSVQGRHCNPSNTCGMLFWCETFFVCTMPWDARNLDLHDGLSAVLCRLSWM